MAAGDIHEIFQRIRLNVREPEVPTGHIGLAMGALAGLCALDERLGTGNASSV
ncbi:hypothetical protein D3C83_267860 [compost metagenome]